jgi:Tfp pilus assembly protein PilP
MLKIYIIFLISILILSSCQLNRNSDKLFEVIPCPEMLYDCNEKPYHDYIELDNQDSIYTKTLLQRIFSSRKITLYEISPDSIGSKESFELEALSCFSFLAFFDKEKKLRYVIGLCVYNYVFTVIDGKNCKIQKGRIIPVSGESFKIREVRQNKALFTKIVQIFEQRGFLLLGKGSWITVCYPEIKPLLAPTKKENAPYEKVDFK